MGARPSVDGVVDDLLFWDSGGCCFNAGTP